MYFILFTNRYPVPGALILASSAFFETLVVDALTRRRFFKNRKWVLGEYIRKRYFFPPASVRGPKHRSQAPIGFWCACLIRSGCRLAQAGLAALGRLCDAPVASIACGTGVAVRPLFQFASSSYFKTADQVYISFQRPVVTDFLCDRRCPQIAGNAPSLTRRSEDSVKHSFQIRPSALFLVCSGLHKKKPANSKESVFVQDEDAVHVSRK